MDKNETILKINKILNKITPYIISDGGFLQFIKYEKGIVYISLTGACKDCPMLDITLKDGIEEILKEEIPEVKEVINI